LVQANLDVFEGSFDNALTLAVIYTGDNIIDDDRELTGVYEASDNVVAGRLILGMWEFTKIDRVAKVWNPCVRVGGYIQLVQGGNVH
jgi:hypothetical protein